MATLAHGSSQFDPQFRILVLIGWIVAFIVLLLITVATVMHMFHTIAELKLALQVPTVSFNVTAALDFLNLGIDITIILCGTILGSQVLKKIDKT